MKANQLLMNILILLSIVLGVCYIGWMINNSHNTLSNVFNNGVGWTLLIGCATSMGTYGYVKSLPYPIISWEKVLAIYKFIQGVGLVLFSLYVLAYTVYLVWVLYNWQ